MMTQSEAFEMLSLLIGKTLSVNGVHGQELKLIAEAYVRMKDQLTQDAKAFSECIARVVPTDEDGKCVVLLISDSVSQSAAWMVGQAFTGEGRKAPPVLLMSDGVDLNLVEGEKIVSQMFEQLPLLRSKFIQKELDLLRSASRHLNEEERDREQSSLSKRIEEVLTENGVAL